MHRSYLYVPGNQPDRFDKAAKSGADAVILDLEDAVSVAEKPRARTLVARYLEAGTPDAALLVRINSDAIADDLDAIGDLPVDALYLAKASVDHLEQLDAALGDRDTEVVALIESAAGLLEVNEIARHPRVRNLAIGEADLTAELGVHPSPDEHHLWPLRMQLVVASAAAGIDPPTGPVSTEFNDQAALAVSTRHLLQGGFGGRACIHPAQVPTVNAVFVPNEEDVAVAQELVRRFDEAVARGEGVITDHEGRMVDEAVVRHARRLLS